MKSGIYKIVNLVNNKIYIGSAINLHKRWILHKSRLKHNKHHCKHLQSSYNKHKENNFIFEVLEYVENQFLILREQHYIDTLNPQYNICKVAGSKLGYRKPKVLKEKLPRKKMTEEHRKNISLGHIGIKHTEITKQKIKESSLGRKLSKETKDKLSEITSKPTLQFTKNDKFIKEWPNATSAANSLKVYPSHISSCCRDKRKSAYGYKWKYKIMEVVQG